MSTPSHSAPAAVDPVPATWLRRIVALFVDWAASSLVAAFVAGGFDSPAYQWLPLIANVVIAVGLAPSVWLARHAPGWRWVAFGVVGGIGVAWVALLFTAL